MADDHLAEEHSRRGVGLGAGSWVVRVKMEITLQVKAKHGALWKAAKQLGGQSALARHLGVSVQEVGGWCNLGKSPPLGTRAKNSKWSDPEWVESLEKALFDLTGQLLDELWPEVLRKNDAFWRAAKTVEIERELDLALLSSSMAERLTLPSPLDEAMHSERRERIDAVLKTLSYREREVLKLRYGLGDGYVYTLKEVAEVFSRTPETIRQIEAKAIRKLQLPRRQALVENV